MNSDMDSETPPAADIPIACTLTSKAATSQALEWVDLRGRSTSTGALDTGVRMTFPAALVELVEDLAHRERSCCAFLTIETSVVDDVLTLEISSPDPAALSVIDTLAGVERS